MRSDYVHIKGKERANTEFHVNDLAFVVSASGYIAKIIDVRRCYFMHFASDNHTAAVNERS